MHRKTIIVATVLSLCGWLSAQQAVRLNELDINQIKQEYGTVTVRDSLVELYAKSIAKVKLDGKAERFVTQIRVGGERVSEHDPQVMLSADTIYDMGPGPGEKGGEIVLFDQAAQP